VLAPQSARLSDNRFETYSSSSASFYDIRTYYMEEKLMCQDGNFE
jgi:hypothetical protein